MMLHGVAEDTLAKITADALTKAVFGTPGSATAKNNSDFLGEVLSKAGQKFVASPQGAKTIDKLSWTVAVPSIVAGIALGYWLRGKLRK